MIATTTQDQQRMRELEQELAYSAARSDIECYCVPVGDIGAQRHWSIKEYQQPQVAANGHNSVRRAVNVAVTYLEWRGCIERDADDASLVRVTDAP